MLCSFWKKNNSVYIAFTDYDNVYFNFQRFKYKKENDICKSSI